MFFKRSSDFIVLNYHRVLPTNSSWNDCVLDVDSFEAQIELLARIFTVLPLEEAIVRAKEKTLPLNCVVITVDDGFSDCYQYIFPILKRYRVKATFFISTAGVERGYLWENQISSAILQADASIKSLKILDDVYSIANKAERQDAIFRITELFKYRSLSERKGLIASLFTQTGEPQLVHDFITEPQLKEFIAEGMTIGAHTVNHPILALESIEVAREEIRRSKEYLEELLSIDVKFFAYPNGKFNTDFSEEHIEIVEKLGFSAAFATNWGISRPLRDGMFRLKRFTPWDRNPWLFTLRLFLVLLSERFNLPFLNKLVGTQRD